MHGDGSDIKQRFLLTLSDDRYQDNSDDDDDGGDDDDKVDDFWQQSTSLRIQLYANGMTKLKVGICDYYL